MKRNELRDELRREMQSVRVSPALSRRTILAARGKGQGYMKKKISMAIAFALIAVTLCAAAIAAANRWGILDFVGRYSNTYIPEDAGNYVESDVFALENEWVNARLSQLYYDGRTSRMTVDVTPKEKNALLVGEDVCMTDPFINLTQEYVMDGENDMRSVLEVYQDSGYQAIYHVNLWSAAGEEGMVGGAMDYRLSEDGTLTIYLQEEYAQDKPQRDVVFRIGITPYDEPITAESFANFEKRQILEQALTLRASVNPTDGPVKEGVVPNVYVNEQAMDFPETGVRVDRVLIEVKPQEIYATVEYSVIDREKYAATDDGLWFEFIDPAKEGDFWQQRLTAGLSGGGSSGPVDGDPETATKFRQTETLGKNELHETYTLRAFNVWEKNRYETREIRMRPATAHDIE